MSSRANRLRTFGMGGLALCLCLVPPASVRADGNEKELEAARHRIRNLLERAEELRQDGQVERAEELTREAAQLKERISDFLSRRRREHGGDGERKEILAGLRAGIGALRALGRNEEAGRLERIAGELQGEHAARRRPRPNREHQVALAQLEIMHSALRALREAGRGDAVDLLENAIRAREVRLEGRRDEEARHILKRAPNREQQAELLALASRLWHEFGHAEEARAIEKLAAQMAGREREREAHGDHPERRERDARHHDEERGREHDARGSHEREHPPVHPEVSAALRSLREELQRLRHEIEDLRARDRHER